MINSGHPAVIDFVPVVLSVLAAGGLGVALASAFLRGRAQISRDLWRRYLAWLIIVPLVLGALALGRTIWTGFVLALSLLTFREYTYAVGLWQYRGHHILGSLVVAATVSSTASGPSESQPFLSPFLLTPLLALIAPLAYELLRGQPPGMLQRSCLVTFGCLYCGWLLGHLAYLRTVLDITGPVLFLLFLVSLNDVTAFTVGRCLGRHLLSPAFSPTKTWEGAIGALLVLVLTAPNIVWLLPGYGLIESIILGLIIAVAATVGDLVMSGLKRDIGIKDWSHTIPGHGGILDRTNSLTFSVPIVCYYVLIVHRL